MYCPYCNVEYTADDNCFCFPRVEIFTPMFAQTLCSLPLAAISPKEPLPEGFSFLEKYRRAV